MTREDLQWFKTQFAGDIAAAVAGTPLTVDLLAAVACQETGHIWAPLRRKNVAVADILATCVGDTIDAPNRRAFPVDKAALLARPHGDRMFMLARTALERMAALVPGFDGAVATPDKFCHGFGIFQCDLQLFVTEPAYFLEERYLGFAACLEKAVQELRRGLQSNGLAARTGLTDLELTSVAIAYNTGRFNPSKGLKQGFKQDGRFYGELIFDFLRLAHTADVDAARATLSAPADGVAALPPPSAIVATGPVFEVDVRDTPLRLRRTPVKSETNVFARLPDGQRVQAVGPPAVDGFLEVETSLNGARLRGFAAQEFLVPVAPVRGVDAAVVVPQPAEAPPTTGVIAVFMPRHPGTVTRRVDLADAHSLNEPDQPARSGATPEALRHSIDGLVDYLAVDDSANKRYQPRDGLTFCNIYAHDYCLLAGVYLPRVWWTGPAIEALTRGEIVEPKIEATISEQRANDLFRWLRDFGLRFGWRQTGSLTTLQTEVNQGAVGLIVARRTDDGRPGHMVAILPETGETKARRDADGSVVAPVQSQAGATNFRRGLGRTAWWTGAQFADSAFWLHS